MEGTAVVTGGARGIGYATVLRFLRAGMDVAIVDLRNAPADHLKLVGAKSGGRSLFVKEDVTSFPGLSGVADRVLREFGRIDVWVNNAGWDRIAPFLSTTPEDWEKILAINLRGVINGTRVALDVMTSLGIAGAIVNVASDAGRVGSTGEAVYSAAKGGVIAFSKAIAREVAQHGIRVNCVSPGPTETPLLAENFATADGQKTIEAIKRGIPFKRLGVPEEIAAAIVFLASEEASYITGQVLSVNGGLNMVG